MQIALDILNRAHLHSNVYMKLSLQLDTSLFEAFEVHHNGRNNDLGQWTKKEKMKFDFKAVITLHGLVLGLN